MSVVPNMSVVVPDPESYLKELRSSVFQALVQKLSRQDNWRKLVAFLPMFDEEYFEQKPCAPTAILNELDDRLCKVKNLRSLLLKCQMYDAAALLSEPQCLVIEDQSGNDEDIFIPYCGELRLEVVASGVPLPQFLWYCDNEVLSDQKNSVLIIKDFEPQHTGEYKCLITQECSDHDHSQFSTPVNVTMLPEPPIIQEQPEPVSVRVGEEIVLSCKAISYPPPRYEWMCGNTVLVGENNSTLKIPCATSAYSGVYKCYVSNGFNVVATEAVKVFVCESPSEIGPVQLPIVTEKVALLIANAKYTNLCDLHTPYNDVKALADILKSLGFKVVTLCDLTRIEMINAVKAFCNLIPEGSYTYFYFAGHGFELHDKYMLPVECPTANLYQRGGSLNERHVIKKVLAKKPHLLLLMLDMCLKVPTREENPGLYDEQVPPISYDSQRNLIQAYATTSNLGAYERMTEENGVYMTHLLKFLSNDMPIVQILQRVIRSVSEENSDAVKLQMPSLSYNVVPERHYLTIKMRENCETIRLYNKMTNLRKSMDLHFSRVNRYAHLKFSFFGDCFLNAMEIQLYNLHDWSISCEVQSLDLEMHLGIIDGVKVIAIQHLQKLKTPKLPLTIKLSDVKNVVDFVLFEIDIPIGCCNLWFSEEENEGVDSSIACFLNGSSTECSDFDDHGD